MSKLLRYYAPGQCCFITSVTANRQPILDHHADLLFRAVRRAHKELQFTMVAWVVLPDHLHTLIECPAGDLPRIAQRVKLSFSLQYRLLHQTTGPVWQRRYWDHIIRSAVDLKRHLDYIHYNPVKHGLADSPKKWLLSSFHRYLKNGAYDPDWAENMMRSRMNHSESDRRFQAAGLKTNPPYTVSGKDGVRAILFPSPATCTFGNSPNSVARISAAFSPER